MKNETKRKKILQIATELENNKPLYDFAKDFLNIATKTEYSKMLCTMLCTYILKKANG